MKYFLDTEFIEDGKTIDLISIGIVAEDGREYYAINYNCDFSKANDWVKENVINQLPLQPLPRVYPTAKDFQASNEYKQGWRTKGLIADEIRQFCLWRSTGFTPYDSYNKVNINNYDRLEPEFWGYYADYDWVVFCQLFGKMIDLPTGFPMYCRDVKQLCDSLGNPELPEQNEDEHHALHDARWIKKAYEFLINIKSNGA